MKKSTDGNEVYFGHTLTRPSVKGDLWTIESPSGRIIEGNLLTSRDKCREVVRDLLDHEGHEAIVSAIPQTVAKVKAEPKPTPTRALPVFFLLDGGVAQGTDAAKPDSNGNRKVWVTHSQRSPSKVGAWQSVRADQVLTVDQVTQMRKDEMQARRVRKTKSIVPRTKAAVKWH